MRIDRQRMPRLRSRLVAIALTLAALGIGYLVLLHGWFVAPLLGINAQIRDLQAIHARYVAAIAQQPLLERRVQKLERSGATEGAFLPGTDPSLAIADLIQRATSVVASHAQEGSGCSMPSKMPIEQDHNDGPYRRVSVSITLDCGIQPLASVLHDFNRGLPYLFVGNLQLSHASPARMQAQLTLSGYLRPVASP